MRTTNCTIRPSTDGDGQGTKHETWWEYVQRISRRESQTAIAHRAGLTQTTVSNWKLGKTMPDASTVIAFARAYDRPPVQALIVAGYLRPEEASGEVIEIAQSVVGLDDKVLIRELVRRLGVQNVNEGSRLTDESFISEAFGDGKGSVDQRKRLGTSQLAKLDVTENDT